jgi:hypothetical protein
MINRVYVKTHYSKVINTYTITNTQQTVHENLAAGMYFIREKQSGAVQKLVVQ